MNSVREEKYILIFGSGKIYWLETNIVSEERRKMKKRSSLKEESSIISEKKTFSIENMEKWKAGFVVRRGEPGCC